MRRKMMRVGEGSWAVGIPSEFIEMLGLADVARETYFDMTLKDGTIVLRLEKNEIVPVVAPVVASPDVDISLPVVQAQMVTAKNSNEDMNNRRTDFGGNKTAYRVLFDKNANRITIEVHHANQQVLAEIFMNQASRDYFINAAGYRGNFTRAYHWLGEVSDTWRDIFMDRNIVIVVKRA